jgi:hypothetical protein
MRLSICVTAALPADRCIAITRAGLSGPGPKGDGAWGADSAAGSATTAGSASRSGTSAIHPRMVSPRREVNENPRLGPIDGPNAQPAESGR